MTAEAVGRIRSAGPADLERILDLLERNGLPGEGVREHLETFLVLEVGGEIAGTVGLEPYGQGALLRSLAVSSRRRGEGWGLRLCRAVVEEAVRIGMGEIFLLTETAAPFFQNLGFETIDREAVPSDVRTSVEFKSCCPASARCMRLRPGPTSLGQILVSTKQEGAMNRNGHAEIKEAVRRHYGERVSGGSCCCGESTAEAPGVPAGRLAAAAGYAEEDLAAIPQNAVSNAFGCGNPLALAGVEEGQTVLDIGSGAGIDCFLASAKVGKTGRVIGIDMTEAMLERARANARNGGYENVEFRRGEAEAMPVGDAEVDWIISNCVINLSPDKPAVFSEIARVLRPGGRFAISDIVTASELPEPIVRDLAAWSGCIGGAIPESEYVAGLEAAGLKDVRVIDRVAYDESVLESLRCCGEGSGEGLPAGELRGRIWSARIVGRR